MTITTSDMLVFALTDALQMPLHQYGKELRGAKDMQVQLGSLKQTWAVTVKSDQVSVGLISLFVRVKGDYWLYMISSSAGIWAFPFDGAAAKIRAGAEKEFGTGEVKTTLKKLKAAGALRGIAHEFPEETREWKEMDAADLIGRL